MEKFKFEGYALPYLDWGSISSYNCYSTTNVARAATEPEEDFVLFYEENLGKYQMLLGP